MPVLQEARKNYIGVVNDTTEDERAALSAARSQSRVMSYLVSRLRAALKRRPKGIVGPPPAP